LNRELVAEGFLDSRREWLVMLDDDIVPSAEAIENMLAVGGSVVVGSCPVVLGKPARLVANVRRSRAEGWLSWPLNESRPFMIDAAGFGCVLIHKSVFARLPRPWYVSDAGQTEDIYFCRQAREAGVPIVAHPGVVCDHCKPILIGAFAECLSKTDRLHPGHAME
jgi:GT2 family glycosyltransferase